MSFVRNNLKGLTLHLVEINNLLLFKLFLTFNFRQISTENIFDISAKIKHLIHNRFFSSLRNIKAKGNNYYLFITLIP
jgi:hypothetical protein